MTAKRSKRSKRSAKIIDMKLSADDMADFIGKNSKPMQINALPSAHQLSNMAEELVNSMSMGNTASDNEWIEIPIDSGAVESVCPENWCSQFPLLSTDRSRGANYVSATGHKIPNLGERQVMIQTEDNAHSGMRFQATHVNQPLGSVARICDANHRVVFDKDGSFIRHKLTGRVIPLHKQNGLYMMRVKVQKPAGFSGRGR